MNRPEPGALRAGDVLTRRYLLMEQIGRGGMSVIWRGFDQSLQRMVAVKVLEADLGTDRELIRREARATARLIHPDAIEVYDYGETVTSHGRLAAYVVMRLLEGRPLADRIIEGPLPWAEAVEVAAKVATVLAAAHERGIVHRDVTAENVLLTPDGAKLLDFGIAAFVGEEDDRTGEYGTPPYVAPERLTGRTADPASDVYSLGVLLFEMLTGAPPYPERTWEEIENARRDGPPPEVRVPGLPPGIAELCRRCLAHDPTARPGAREAAGVLSEALSGSRTERRSASSRVPPLAAVAALILSAGALVWSQTSGERGDGAIALEATSRPTAAGTHSPSAPPETGSGTSRPRAGGPDAAPTGEPTAGPDTAPTGEPDTAPAAGPDAAPVEETAGEPSGEPTVLLVESVGPPRPTLNQSVRRFNTLLDQGADRGEIRPDVALDIRQVLANAVCCAQDLAPVRQKITDRHREGSLPSRLHEALNDQLKVVAVALAG
ncbi:protein kinase [Planomonospora corallina]|uniref:non-specific serine/threonine protein kinase n=1 Tax=Planomonospora corallina TaxID=1806052 RepID=A0ABV8IFA2_9ACTN